MVGLFKRQKWGPKVILIISIFNRAIVLLIFEFSVYYFIWFTWTLILLAVAYIDYRRLSRDCECLICRNLDWYSEVARKQGTLRHVPSVLSSLRLIVIPFLVFSLIFRQQLLGDLLFVFAIATDYFDGYFARKFGVSSKNGAWFDVTADFLLICIMFMTFIVQGIYPAWILLLIIFNLMQFLATNTPSKLIYDPVGKHYGSFLFGAIRATLLFSGQLWPHILITMVYPVRFHCIDS